MIPYIKRIKKVISKLLLNYQDSSKQFNKEKTKNVKVWLDGD